MRLSLVITVHSLAPTAVSHSASGTSAAKWVSCNSTVAPASRKASPAVQPRLRSMKKVIGSGGGFVADRFFDFMRRPPVVLGQKLDRIAGLVALDDDRGGNAGARQTRPAE